ncbi:MAG: hypothetical protein JW818_07855 [Pirellulales bacterium]|nr:hypothetical protein [Pirellulales bacterium]
MQYVALVVQIGIAIGLFLLWQWLKQLPAAIHKRQEQLYQQQLDRELELLKISQSQIQLRKIEKFMDFAKLQADILTNEAFKARIQKNDPKAVAQLREVVVELGIGLFFFASDSTVREYGTWKTETAQEGVDPIVVLSGLGALMVALRKDVGYEDTELRGSDYLKMFITDWDDVESKIAT